MAQQGVLPALLEQGAGRLEGCDYRVDRRCRVRRVDKGAHEEVLQLARAPEQHLALVGEVPEERPLRQSGPGADLRHRGLFEPALRVESEGGLLEPTACVWFPSPHALI